MALTLAEADKYSTNQVLVGVAEITMDQNPLLGLLPFTPIRGNALQYQRELAASAPTFIAAGGTVIEGVPTTSLITTALKILIGDADIDNFLRVTRSKDQDLRAELLAIKARNFADTWGDAAIYGSIDAAAAQFDGLHEISFRYFDRIVVLVRLVAVVADTPAPFEDAEPFGRRAPATFQSQAGGTDAPCSTPATTLQLSAGSMPTCENDRLPTVFPSEPETTGS